MDYRNVKKSDGNGYNFPKKSEYNFKRNGGYKSSKENGRGVNNYEKEDNLEVREGLAVGRNAVKELLADGRDVEKIYVQKGEREGSINVLIGIASERKIPIVELDKQKMDRMCANARHQGIIALASEQNYSTIDEIFEYAEEKGEPPFIVLLDGVEDPHNLGAIIRSAECMGAHGIIIPKRRAVGLTPTVAKASAGAIMHMRIAKVTNLSQTIDELKERGVWFYAADMDGESIYETNLTGAVGIVLGSEGDGISRLVKEKCDFVISVPMYGKVNSMNVSCAAAVVLSVAANQRRKGGAVDG
ncbi:MAG: 23S rRNA (guanosine(2251)-2'-O)-methyltransferase RlmB [Ruminococcaceae bacterium]|nr:23S rRNA (guanosine(2251)-2'-O)-methyltransferase RlmB [Oscillospiraceae bacterium]